LRTETGLPFTSGQAGVTIEVIDGVSEPLVEIAREHPDRIAWWIFLNRPKLEAAADGFNVLGQRMPEIARSPLGRQVSEGDPDAVQRSHDLIRRLLADEIDKPIVWSEFADSTADWLGAYFNRLPRLRYQRIGELTSKSQTAKPPGFDTDGFAFVPQGRCRCPRSLTRHSAGLSNWECGLFTSSPATLPRLRRQSSPTGKL
jgi:hypothetical protein